MKNSVQKSNSVFTKFEEKKVKEPKKVKGGAADWIIIDDATAL